MSFFEKKNLILNHSHNHLVKILEEDIKLRGLAT
jgi:hypothetical protein